MKLQAQIESWLHQQWSKKGVFSLVMRPLSKLAQYYIKYQSQQPRAQLPFSAPPIIVVGNIIVGGAGKTPVVLALCEYLKNQGWQPGIISRGYGVTINGPARVGQGVLSAADFGDEPSLIAQQTGVPIAVHPQRVQALTALCQQHPEVNVVIADDGLQHQALPRDIEIIVQDQRGIGNGLVLPAGPLREPPSRLQHADWLITQLPALSPMPATPAPATANRSVTMRLQATQMQQLHTGKRLTFGDWLAQYRQCSMTALAAIGQPQRFFSMLEQAGLQLEQCIAHADHHPIAASTFSQQTASILLITAKDAVKCTDISDPRIWVVHVAPQFTPSTWLVDLEQKLHELTLLG